MSRLCSRRLVFAGPHPRSQTFGGGSAALWGRPPACAGLLAPLLCLFLLVLPACRSGQPQPGADTEVIRTHEEGDVSVTVRMPSGQITTADRLELTVEVRGPEGTGVRFPNQGKLGDFTAVRAQDADPRLIGQNRMLVARTYVLEPPVPGEYEIPSLELRLGPDKTIRTEPIPIRVASVIPDAEAAPALKDIAPPVELPGLSPWIYFLMGVTATALALVAWWLWKRRRRRAAAAAAPEPPHQAALRELRKLLDEDLIGKGLSKLFYLRLSNILRHYIEDRFGLRAPERTTEEFLLDLRQEQMLNERQKELLKQFLVHCDMVKFAEHQPNRAEVDGAVNTCAQFIAETRVEAPVTAGS